MKMILPHLGKGDRGGFVHVDSLRNPPRPPFFKGGGILSMKFMNDTRITTMGNPFDEI